MAIQHHFDMAALRGDFFLVPLAERFLRSAFGGDDIINRPVILHRAKVFVLRRAVVQHLDFHAGVGGVALVWSANPNAIIGTVLESEFKTENKIFVFLFGKQIATAAVGAIKNAIGDAVTRAILTDEFPAIK